MPIFCESPYEITKLRVRSLEFQIWNPFAETSSISASNSTLPFSLKLQGNLELESL